MSNCLASTVGRFCGALMSYYIGSTLGTPDLLTLSYLGDSHFVRLFSGVLIVRSPHDKDNCILESI